MDGKFLVFAVISSFVISENQTIACRKGNRCCSGFVEKRGICTPCPNGTFGVNCSDNCPNGYYGYLCLTKCDCSLGQPCSPIYGCSPVDNAEDKEVKHNNSTDYETETNKHRLNSTNMIFAVIGLSTFVILISVFLFRLWLRNKTNRHILGGQTGRRQQNNDYSQEENGQIHGQHSSSLATSAEYSTGLNINEEHYNQLELRVNNTYCKSVDMDCMEQLQFQNGGNDAYSYSDNAGQNNWLHTESSYDTIDDTNL